jgi:hypothetical protein
MPDVRLCHNVRRKIHENSDGLTVISLRFRYGFYSIPLACAECDNSLLFSGASSISLCYILFPATLLHQLFFRPPSLHLAIYFLVCPMVCCFQTHIQYSFGNSIFFNSLYMYLGMDGNYKRRFLVNCPYDKKKLLQ